MSVCVCVGERVNDVPIYGNDDGDNGAATLSSARLNFKSEKCDSYELEDVTHECARTHTQIKRERRRNKRWGAADMLLRIRLLAARHTLAARLPGCQAAHSPCVRVDEGCETTN